MDFFYYRTRNGAVVDLVLKGGFGIVPIEIKFGSLPSLKQLTSLRQFVKKHQLPFGIVVNNSEEARLISEDIIQIPAGCL